MKRERGSVALELAIVAPVLMLLVLGRAPVRALVPRPERGGDGRPGGRSGRGRRGRDRRGGRSPRPRGAAGGPGQAAEVEGATASIDQDAARVEVTAQLPGLLPIPGLRSFSLSSEATAFRERFRPAEEG